VKTTSHLTEVQRAGPSARFRIPGGGNRWPPQEQGVGQPVRHPGDVLRVVLAIAVLGATMAVVRHGKVFRLETNLFRLINRLPSALGRPMWLVMQGGALATVFVTSGAALLASHRRLARDLLVSGGLVWLAAKLMKAVIGRARPDVLLPHVVLRHTPATGLGFPSGHVAVATALAAAAAPHLPRRFLRLLGAEAWLVALARVYVGAHLPLDTVGGAAAGWALASAVHLVWVPRRPDHPRGQRRAG
jgi:membrane-associated phospholipid phosphatase